MSVKMCNAGVVEYSCHCFSIDGLPTSSFFHIFCAQRHPWTFLGWFLTNMESSFFKKWRSNDSNRLELNSKDFFQCICKVSLRSSITYSKNWTIYKRKMHFWTFHKLRWHVKEKWVSVKLFCSRGKAFVFPSPPPIEKTWFFGTPPPFVLVDKP